MAKSPPKTEQHADAEVLVSEVIGHGASAHRIATVGDWTLTLPGTDGTEPEIPDTALAPRLGIDLHKLRQLSGRHERAGNIAPRKVSTTVVETPAVGGRPGTQRFYNEVDALFLVTRSETPKAIALTKEMIRVYSLVRRGLYTPASHAEFRLTPEILTAIAAAVAPVVAQVMGPHIASAIQPVAEHTMRTNLRVGEVEKSVGELRSAVEAETATLRTELAALKEQVSCETVGLEGAKKINATLRRIAALYSDKKAKRRVRRQVENKVRNALDYNGPGSDWRYLPKRDAARAEKLLGVSLDEHIALRREAEQKGQRQLEIPLKN